MLRHTLPAQRAAQRPAVFGRIVVGALPADPVEVHIEEPPEAVAVTQAQGAATPPWNCPSARISEDRT